MTTPPPNKLLPQTGRGWAVATGVWLLAEFWLFTWGRNSLGYYVSPVALTLCGALACGTALLCLRWRVGTVAPGGLPVPEAHTARPWIAVGLATALGLVACLVEHAHVLRAFVVRIESSDIIPALSIYPRRLLAGELVYRPFTDELGYFALPTYLPATWGPYLVPQALGFDYRWMAFGLLLLGFGAYLALVLRLRRGQVISFGLALLPFVLTFAVQRTEPAVFGNTVEEMIVGYYFLLAAAILARQTWGLVVALVLCLLSRYSLVFWVPLLLGLIYLQDGRRRALLVAGGVALGVTVLYLIPFLSHDWGLFMRVQASYIDAAENEWKHVNEYGLPYHLYNGVGLGNWFYRSASGDLRDKILLLKRWHFVGLATIVAGAALLYWRAPRLRPDYRVYALLSLKLYLVWFYAFVQVPYAYLATVSIFLSCFLVLLVVGRRSFANAAAPNAAPQRLVYS